MDSPSGPGRKAPTTDELLVQLVKTLDEDPAYELHGELETSPWGSGQWVVFTDAEGKKHYLRIVIEPYRPN